MLRIVFPWTGSFAAVAALTLAVGCSKSSPGHDACLKHYPAFRVQLRASGGRIPDDAVLRVGYGGSEEEAYSVASPPTKNEDVCCRVGAPVEGALPAVSCKSSAVASLLADSGVTPEGGASRRDAGAFTDGGARDGAVADASGSDSGPPEQLPETVLLCELWTNGPAKIHVSARGYDVLDRDLASKLTDDGCGVRTVDARLELTGPDAGR